MIRALYSSASGLQAQQNNLDVIANNLANVNTTGFKKSKIEFQDLLYQATRMAGSEQGAGNALPAGVEVGHGTRTVATARVFTNGEMSQTGEKLDLAIMVSSRSHCPTEPAATPATVGSRPPPLAPWSPVTVTT